MPLRRVQVRITTLWGEIPMPLKEEELCSYWRACQDVHRAKDAKSLRDSVDELEVIALYTESPHLRAAATREMRAHWQDARACASSV